MKKVFLISALTMSLIGCGIVDQGNVGVRTTFGTVNMDPVTTGFYTSFFSSVDEYTTKETNLELSNLTPKAKDNLSLKDMDVAIYYKTNGQKIPSLKVKYSNQSGYNSGIYYPGSVMVENIARSVVYDTISRYDSLVIHTKRDELENTIKENVQKELNANDPDTFTITRVVARSIVTDPSIEQQIQKAVAAQKQLEQMSVQEEIAKKQAQIEITKAEGVSKANQIINGSLTREYLQHEANIALQKFADNNSTHTVVVPASMNVAPLINIK
jgi:hypothetical protein